MFSTTFVTCLTVFSFQFDRKPFSEGLQLMVRHTGEEIEKKRTKIDDKNKKREV